MWIFKRRGLFACGLFLGLSIATAQPSGPTTRSDSPPPPKSPVEPPPAAPDSRKLYDLGKELFDRYAPDEVKDDYEFPSYDQWQEFAGRLQKALESGSLEELAAFEPEARKALAALQYLPQFADYADWLSERLDLIEAARKATQTPLTPLPNRPTPRPQLPEGTPLPPEKNSPAGSTATAVPHYQLWLDRMQNRPQPDRAKELMPLLKMIFVAEGLPPELAWLAEVESSLNPSARSPAGALGLYQLMPATARSLGLSLLPFDERSNPGKNARAAAQLLRKLHHRFDSWPLALAAYNAGEGRVSAALRNRSADTFSQIADSLPSETRMYVPKVFATLAVREKMPLEKWLPVPVAPSSSIQPGEHPAAAQVIPEEQAVPKG